MSWIESHQEIRNHPKTKRFAREIQVSVPTAIGYLHCLWWWATDYAPDGDLTDFADWEIADAAYYEADDPETFRKALIHAGFIDQTDDGRMQLHDWHDYGGKNLKRQRMANERNKRYRERQQSAEIIPEDTLNSENEPDVLQEEFTDTVPNEYETVTSASQIDSECVTGASRDANECVTSASQDGNERVTRASRDRHRTHTQDRTGHDKTGHEITPHSPPQGGGGGSGNAGKSPPKQERQFEEFWSAYPKKQGKGAAQRVWNRIRPDNALFAVIMDSVKAHAEHNPQWLKDGGQYIPNPSTWLNQERWQDEMPREIAGDCPVSFNIEEHTQQSHRRPRIV